MPIELHNSVKPASSRRALTCSIILLAFVSTLAATMSWSRAREQLAARIRPPGWSISFRPPKQFLHGGIQSTTLGPAFPLYRAMPDGSEVVLAIRCFSPGPNDDAIAVCAHFVREDALMSIPGGPWPSPGATPAKLGPFDGVEIHAPQTATIARVAVPDSAVGYAVILAAKGAPIDDSLYHLFDLTCRSIEHESR